MMTAVSPGSSRWQSSTSRLPWRISTPRRPRAGTVSRAPARRLPVDPRVENVLVSGATGTGKSYMACALGHSACRHGLSTRYYRFSRLLGELALARADGSYAKLLDRLAKTHLLILDDFGLAPLTDSERRDFLEVLEDR